MHMKLKCAQAACHRCQSRDLVLPSLGVHGCYAACNEQASSCFLLLSQSCSATAMSTASTYGCPPVCLQVGRTKAT